MAFRTSFWWPDVRVSLDEYDEVEGTEKVGEEVTKKGTKRKRAHPTKGPCEHGVKYRSNCKVCSACPHGKWRSKCKECGGVSNLRARSYTLYVQGVRWVWNLRARSCTL